MTITAVRITVPYPPPAELTEDIYEDAEAVWGAEAEIELDAEPTDRGLGAVDPVVLVVVTYLGGRLLDLTTEAAFKSVGERFRRLLTRLRHGDGAGGELGYEIRVEGVGPSGAVFHFDAAATADQERALAEMVRLDVSRFPADTHLMWDAAIGCWHRAP